jgi:hypothetical protein
VARAALGLAASAAGDDSLRGDRSPRDQTLNRAFSRRFFEAVEAERRAEIEAAARRAGDTAESPVLLDETLGEDVDDEGDPGTPDEDEGDAPDAADSIVAEFAREGADNEDGGQDDQASSELDAEPDAEPGSTIDAEEGAGAEGSDRAPG